MTKEEISKLIVSNGAGLRHIARNTYRRRFLNNRCAAAWTVEDLYQESVLKAIKYAHLFDGQKFLSWMSVLFYRVAIDVINHERKKQYVDVAGFNGESEERTRTVPDSLIDDSYLPDELTAMAIDHEAIVKAIEQLRPKQAEVLLYPLNRDNVNITEPHIAEQLGVNLNFVKKARFFSYKKLAKSLAYLNPKLT